MASRSKTILDAIEKVNFYTVKSYMNQFHADELNIQDQSGNTLLHKATQKLSNHYHPKTINDCVRIVALLAQYVDGRIRNKYGKLAVHAVFKSQNRNIRPALDALLAQRGVIELCYEDEDLMAYAVEWCRWDIVQRMIERENDRTKQSQHKQVALNTICSENITPPDYIMLLLRDVINVQELFADSPLLIAAQMGNVPCMLKLIEHGADISAVGKDNYFLYSALSLALQLRRELTSDVYAALIHPSIINLRTGDFGDTSLHLAIRKGYRVAIKELVKAGADLTIRGQCRWIPLETALKTEVFLCNSQVIFQLIPHSIDSLMMVEFLSSVSFYPQIIILPHLPELLARMFLATMKEDFFSLCNVQICSFLSNEKTWVIESTCNDDERYFVPTFLLSALSVLVRRCVGGKTSPQCTATLTMNRALYDAANTSEGSEERFQNLVEKAREIDEIFDDPLSLLVQCCFVIRKHIVMPKFENVRQLLLPKELVEKVTFLDLAREFCKIIRSNRALHN